MTMAKRGALVTVLFLVFGTAARAAELSDADRQRAEQWVQDLGDADPAKRAAAETELRSMGPKVAPVLSKSTVPNEAGQVRLRAILVDLSVDSSRIDPTDAGTLMQLGREEALAKRYDNAHRCYRRAEKIYDRLKDDADDMKDKVKRTEYRDREQTAKKRADKAERLAKGHGFSGLNLGVVKIGVEHDNSDQDW
mgnify:CR=1 FL=1